VAALLIAMAAPSQAQTGNPDAQYQAGFAAFQKRDYADACKKFQAAAAQGHVASKSMIQMLNGYGYHCAAPSAQAAAAPALPDMRALYAGALEEARAWQSDAVLTLAQASNQAHPGYYTVTFLFISPSARQALSLDSAQMGGPIAPLTGNAAPAVLPGNFVNLAAAVTAAQRAGLKGAIDSATLTIWQGPGGPPLPGWLLHAPQNGFETFLVGALDGKLYPVSRYSHPVEGNDQQIRAMQSAANHAAAPPPSAQRGNSCGGAQRFNWFSPCNHAALMNLYRQSNSNYDMWKAGKRATPD
jgi:hypothetical protein